MAIGIGVLASFPNATTAQSTDDERVGISQSGLRGIRHTGLPVASNELNLAASLGYGLIDAPAGPTNVHERLQSTLAIGGSPLEWLSLAFQIDGKLDFHPDDGRGTDSTAVGDPRLVARVGRALEGDTFQLGGELGVWLPGRDAPSLVPGATSVDLKAMGAWLPKASAWTWLAAAGVRLDQSARSAPDLTRLRRGDRLSLGISDFHALLFALGAAYRSSPATEWFGELSADALIGAGAPSLIRSPLRLSLGARHDFSRDFQGELMTVLSLSRRPGLEPDDPLVPIEPRVLLMLGVRYGALRRKPPPEDPPSVETWDLPQVPVSVELEGRVVDPAGAPIFEAEVRLRVGDDVRNAITDGAGRYRFAHLPKGTAHLEVAALGFHSESWTGPLELAAGAPQEHVLTPKPPTGVLRGLTRSFDSTPLAATIRVRASSGREVAQIAADAEGAFELELEPGKYHIAIEAQGHRRLQKNIRIVDRQVTILNVDMRAE